MNEGEIELEMLCDAPQDRPQIEISIRDVSGNDSVWFDLVHIDSKSLFREQMHRWRIPAEGIDG
jgi:hypothetical protein